MLFCLSTTPLSAQGVIEIEGLRGPAKIVRDAEGIPHIFTIHTNDAYFLLGYVHAEDRFFQLDYLRRQFDGTLAELFGDGALGADAQMRMFNLQAVAEATIPQLPNKTRQWLAAYSDGVNAWLSRNPAPEEYALLELTSEAIRPWRPTDTVLLMKGIAFSWFDLGDLDRTLAFQNYLAAGGAGGFDGNALFHEDIFRLAPVVAEKTVGGGEFHLASGKAARVQPESLESLAAAQSFLRPEVLEQAREVKERIRGIDLLAPNLEAQQNGRGSNWWLVSGDKSRERYPMLANDGHQNLAMPPLTYEVHLLIGAGLVENLSGKTFPGLPLVISGCNSKACWGATNGSLDMTDVFQEQLLIDPVSGEPTHTLYRGQAEEIVAIPQRYRVNRVGDGVQDNLEEVTLRPLSGGKVFLVPRRLGGPLLIFGPTGGGQGFGISVQFTGWAPNQDLEAFRQLQEANNLSSFRKALRSADGVAFNFGYADTSGNIAYFLSGELPLREDLESLGRVDGAPPYLIRDGSGQFRNEWMRPRKHDSNRALPYEILPLDEMPSEVNPSRGYIVSANNDPLGLTFDNDVLNERRPTGGVFYLNRSYAAGFRAAVIREMIEDKLARTGRLSMRDFREIQSNNQLLDAALLIPHVVQALQNGLRPGAPAELAALAADPRVREAVGRLEQWDLSTPTGIAEGYDPGDDPENLEEPSSGEVAASVATTIFSLLRSQLVETIVDGSLARVGLGGALPPDRQALTALFGLLEGFADHQGYGASGVDFFPVSGVAGRADARDVVLLRALTTTLDRLAGDDFALAFQRSNFQDDYRWGLLHRISLVHPLGGPFNVPEGSTFQSISPELPGLSKAGGLNTVDVAANRVRVRDVDDFTFNLAPGGRMVALVKRNDIQCDGIVPGGVSGSPDQPTYTNQLGRWLTNGYKASLISPLEVLLNAESWILFVPGR